MLYISANGYMFSLINKGCEKSYDYVMTLKPK